MNNFKYISKKKRFTKKIKPIISSKLKHLFIKNTHSCINLTESIRFNRRSPINFINKRDRSKKFTLVYPKIRTTYRKKVLISFGIVDYLHWPKLKNAINDVNAFSKFAKDKLNFDIVYVYNDKNVTKASIERIITHDLYKITDKEDLIVMSFHGHGHSINFGSFIEGFLVPYDAPNNPTPFELISMNNLSKWFNYVKANHILLLLDCCFSGLSVLRKDPSLFSKTLTRNDINIHINSKSRIIINAGTNSESVSDGGWNNNSIFTGALLSSPTLENKLGSVIDLYYYLLNTIPRYCNQTPSIGKMEGDMGTDIFLKL
tara:strand:+ start:2136 stop:3083 length:948 start_codon:yes stop_codon:yes gene_type:complete